MKLEHVSELKFNWRREVNGEEHEEYQVKCDCCNQDEENIKDLFWFTLSDEYELLICDECIGELRNLRPRKIQNSLRRAKDSHPLQSPIPSPGGRSANRSLLTN